MNERACRYNLAIAVVFQDEAPFLKEWIEYHLMMGVDHFVLVNDRSRDDFGAVLKPYIDADVVRLFSHPCPVPLQGPQWPEYQRRILEALLQKLTGVARWVALIDVDEFLVPTDARSILEFLADHEDAGGVYVRWQPFGTSYVPRLAAGELLTERLRLSWRFVPGYEMLGKSVVKPHRVRHANIHRSTLHSGFAYVDANPDMQSASPAIKVHHYWSRDEHFLFNVKLPRTAAIKGWQIDDARLEYFRTLFNDVPDDSMTRFVPALQARVFGDAVGA